MSVDSVNITAMMTLSTVRGDDMATRQEQYREAQRKRRERMKESGVKAITLELSATAHARLRALSLAMFGDASQPSKVVESLLTTSTAPPTPEPELTVSTISQEPEPKKPMSATMAAILRNQAMESEWARWPWVMGIDPVEWYRAKSNADRTAMAKKAFRPLASKHHPDKGGDPEMMQAYQRVYDVIVGGKKSPLMPKKWAGWGLLREV